MNGNCMLIVCPDGIHIGVDFRRFLTKFTCDRQCYRTYFTVHCVTLGYDTLQCSTVQYSAVQCSTVQYTTVQCSTLQYSTL